MDKRNFLIKKMISLLAVFAMFLSFGSPLTSKVVKAAGQAPTNTDKAVGTVENVEEAMEILTDVKFDEIKRLVIERLRYFYELQSSFKK